jgi:hypothetical protein
MISGLPHSDVCREIVEALLRPVGAKCVAGDETTVNASTSRQYASGSLSPEAVIEFGVRPLETDCCRSGLPH